MRIGRRGRLAFPILVSRKRGSPGFTLMEMVIVMAIIGILASIVAPMVMTALTRAREATLQQDLKTMRKLIDDYYGDKGVFPPSLQVLVTQGYLRAIPRDPVKASGVFAIDDNLDVVQIRPPALFELNRLGGANREQSAAFLRLGDGKALGRLLNIQAQLGRNAVDDLAQTPLRVEINPRNRSHHQNRAQGKPAAQP